MNEEKAFLGPGNDEKLFITSRAQQEIDQNLQVPFSKKIWFRKLQIINSRKMGIHRTNKKNIVIQLIQSTFHLYRV